MTKTKRVEEIKGFVKRQAAFVADLKTRKFEHVPHIRPFHEKTLAEAQELLDRAQKTLAALAS